MSDRNAQQRKTILSRAAETLCQQPGLDMVGLAEATGVSRATLYRYFPNREQLIRALAFQSIEDMDAAADGIFEGLRSYRDAFRALIDAIVPLGAAYHFLARESNAFEDPDVKAALRRQDAELAGMIEEAKEAGELDRELPTRWIAEHLDAVVWIAWSQVAEGHVARNDAASLAFRTFWGGVSAPRRSGTKGKRKRGRE